MKYRKPCAILILCMQLFLLSACFHNDTGRGELLLQDHILVNKIWHVESRRFISLDQMLADIHKAEYVLLGETHDNIEHHRKQARIIHGLHESKREVAVYFEMIDEEQGKKLSAEKIDSVQKLIDLLDQEQHGWDYEGMYRVVFEASMRAGYKILPANIQRDSVVDLMQREFSDWPEDIRTVIAHGALSDEQYQDMRKEAVEAHCNSLPESMIDPMIRAQRLRDAKMAMNMKQADEQVKLLITGAGHARKDRGVPHYLVALGVEEENLVSLAMIEVAEDMSRVSDYTERWGGHLPFDYIWFTPRFGRPDPCEGLEMHMMKKAEK